MANPILGSICQVAEAVQKSGGKRLFIPLTSSFMKPTQKVGVLLDSMRSVAGLVSLQLDGITEPAEKGLGLFHSLGIQFDEVIHSRAIAKCFSDATPRIAAALLGSFLEQSDDSIEVKSAEILIWTERSLGSLPNGWKIDSSIRARRLDILIEHPDLVLAIENKIESHESEHQTTDYYSALQIAFGKKKKVVGILLSPDKAAPQCEEFRSLSYVDLYGILERVVRDHGQERIGFLRLYAKELFDIFVQQRRRSYLQTIEYWKGKAA